MYKGFKAALDRVEDGKPVREHLQEQIDLFRESCDNMQRELDQSHISCLSIIHKLVATSSFMTVSNLEHILKQIKAKAEEN